MITFSLEQDSQTCMNDWTWQPITQEWFCGSEISLDQLKQTSELQRLQNHVTSSCSVTLKFFLLWIVVTGMGVSSPERQWLLQMTRQVICNPMWGSIYVNGSNLVRKEMTTADDKMGDLQSDERFFLCKFPLPWVVTPALQTQYILVVLALDSIA